jgi:hypothetical protein
MAEKTSGGKSETTEKEEKEESDHEVRNRHLKESVFYMCGRCLIDLVSM